MNLHPIFVHFPIALLTLYSLFECLRFKSLTTSKSFLWVKIAFLFIGVFGGMASLSTGEMAQDAYSGGFEKFIEFHEAWASTTIWLYGVLAIMYLLHLFVVFFPQDWKEKLPKQLTTVLSKLEHVFFRPFILVTVAIIALLALSVTGALGGLLTHGTGVDPLVDFVYVVFSSF